MSHPGTSNLYAADLSAVLLFLLLVLLWCGSKGSGHEPPLQHQQFQMLPMFCWRLLQQLGSRWHHSSRTLLPPCSSTACCCLCAASCCCSRQCTRAAAAGAATN